MKDLLTKLLDPLKETREEYQAKQKAERDRETKRLLRLHLAKARAIAKKNGQ